MVLDEEEKIKDGLKPQLAEYKVIQIFLDKNWSATQRYYEIQEGEQLRDLDIHAEKRIKQNGEFFEFLFRLEMHVSVKYRQKFTFVGVKWPTDVSINKQVIKVFDPIFYDYIQRHSLIYNMPNTPAPFLDDSYEIYVQEKPNSQRFDNKDIFVYARKLFDAWFSRNLYGYVKSWTDCSFDEIINEEWLNLFKDFKIKKSSENRDHDVLPPDNRTLSKMFLKEKKIEALKTGRPTFYGVICVPLLVVGSESCHTLEYNTNTSSLVNFTPMDWIKCNNYIFPFDKDQINFGFYFMPLKNVSQFIDKFENYARQWVQYFITKEDLFLKMWCATLIDTHLADYERNFNN